MNNRLFKIGIASLYIAVGACTEFVYALDTMFDDAVKVQMKYERDKARVGRRTGPIVLQKEKVEPAYIKDWKERREERRWQAYQNRQARRNANRTARRADSSAERVSWWDRFWGKKPQKIEQPKIEEPAQKDTAAAVTSYDFCNVKVQLMFGNIVEQADVDAIVNAGNPELSDGLGVTGAIWKAAGPELDEYIQDMIKADNDGIRVQTGSAKWTPGFNLKAKRIIHAVGPRGDTPNRAELLKSIYRNILDLYFSENWKSKSLWKKKDGSVEILAWTGGHDYKTIAIPMISVGIYKYPYEEAAGIAVDEVIAWARQHPKRDMTVRFVFFNDEVGKESFELYKKLFGQACAADSFKIMNFGSDADHDTPLMVAIKEGRFQDAIKLIDAGVDVNVIVGWDQPHVGYSALGLALKSSAPIEIMEKLIKAGGDVNGYIEPDAYSFLFNKMIEKKGLSAQKKFMARNHTLLSYAIGTKKPIEVIKLLIDSGADVNKLDFHKQGVTPLMVAREVSYDEVIPLLRKAGAHEASLPIQTK
jgi:O-acetyl-ADP-ribose deacetylase (regulator of RNase III)